jgi:ubiquinone/menaquinone biosynthesis C-methylase UbiE
MKENSEAKNDVRDFWNQASCGEELYLHSRDSEGFEKQMQKRYELEPYILDFAGFKEGAGKKVLEIGVGLGADHEMWARNNPELFGVDLTPRAIENTTARFQSKGLKSTLKVDDAEKLSFADDTFDIVYSWGVLHHSPNTPTAINEVHRVLKPGGTAKIMIYYKYSFVGYMLWVKYALLKFKPFTSLKTIYHNYLESPGTKAYSKKEAQELFKKYKDVQITTVLTHGDLLTSAAGQRHEGAMLNIARKIWPRFLIKTFFPSHGLFMLITAKK